MRPNAVFHVNKFSNSLSFYRVLVIMRSGNASHNYKNQIVICLPNFNDSVVRRDPLEIVGRVFTIQSDKRTFEFVKKQVCACHYEARKHDSLFHSGDRDFRSKTIL